MIEIVTIPLIFFWVFLLFICNVEVLMKYYFVHSVQHIVFVIGHSLKRHKTANLVLNVASQLVYSKSDTSQLWSDNLGEGPIQL